MNQVLDQPQSLDGLKRSPGFREGFKSKSNALNSYSPVFHGKGIIYYISFSYN